MASHVQVKSCAASEWQNVDAGDLEEGWSGVELALAYVGEMVGGLDVVEGDVTHCGDDEVTSCRRPTSPSSVQLTDDKDDDDDDAVNSEDNDARRCINDACELL